MAGFGGELLFFIGLGYVVLGPRRMHDVLQRIARAKRDFDKTRAELTAQLSRVNNAEKKSLSIDICD
jgi:Sec-independent protein translocase protein TatA